MLINPVDGEILHKITVNSDMPVVQQEMSGYNQS